jgi:hypothetical protein
MKCPTLAVAAFTLLLIPSSAWAIKTFVDLTPQGLRHHDGFEVETVKRDNGTIGFTVTRDPTKARWHGRDGRLEVHGKDGLIAECYVEGKEEGGKIRYWFAVMPDHLEFSSFTIAEIQTGEVDGRQEKLLGGGTYYRMRLKDFQPTTKP